MLVHAWFADQDIFQTHTGCCCFNSGRKYFYCGCSKFPVTQIWFAISSTPNNGIKWYSLYFISQRRHLLKSHRIVCWNGGNSGSGRIVPRKLSTLRTKHNSASTELTISDDLLTHFFNIRFSVWCLPSNDPWNLPFAPSAWTCVAGTVPDPRFKWVRCLTSKLHFGTQH
jgi:hypothetical protein